MANKIELIEYYTDKGYLSYKIMVNGSTVDCYENEEVANEQFNRLVERFQNPNPEPKIIQSVTL